MLVPHRCPVPSTNDLATCHYRVRQPQRDESGLERSLPRSIARMYDTMRCDNIPQVDTYLLWYVLTTLASHYLVVADAVEEDDFDWLLRLEQCTHCITSSSITTNRSGKDAVRERFFLDRMGKVRCMMISMDCLVTTATTKREEQRENTKKSQKRHIIEEDRWSWSLWRTRVSVNSN